MEVLERGESREERDEEREERDEEREGQELWDGEVSGFVSDAGGLQLSTEPGRRGRRLWRRPWKGRRDDHVARHFRSWGRRMSRWRSRRLVEGGRASEPENEPGESGSMAPLVPVHCPFWPTVREEVSWVVSWRLGDLFPWHGSCCL
jgi:hypothetical protein